MVTPGANGADDGDGFYTILVMVVVVMMMVIEHNSR